MTITFVYGAYGGWVADCSDHLDDCLTLKRKAWEDAEAAGWALDKHLNETHGVAL